MVDYHKKYLKYKQKQIDSLLVEYNFLNVLGEAAKQSKNNKQRRLFNHMCLILLIKQCLVYQ